MGAHGAGSQLQCEGSQRGIINLYHSDAQRDAFARATMSINGIDAKLLDAMQIHNELPLLNHDSPRFPIMGGLMPRANHDAAQQLSSRQQAQSERNSRDRQDAGTPGLS